MFKKVASIISFLFITSLLIVSCSNADKTGSSNSGNPGDSGTASIKKYAGNWELLESGNKLQGVITINEDGTLLFGDLETISMEYKGSEQYFIKIKDPSSGTILLNLYFKDNAYDMQLEGIDGKSEGTIKKI